MGKYSIFLFIFIFFTFHLTSHAQATCGELLKVANDTFLKKDLKEALRLLQLTEKCDRDKSLLGQRSELQNKIFKAIEAERTEAVKQRNAAKKAQAQAQQAQARMEMARDSATQAKEQAEKAKEQAILERDKANEAEKKADNAKKEAIEANEKNERIVKASYFYKDKYALAYQNGKYGFIDKNGKTLIDYDYDHALPFDETLGWALVKKAGKEYYIDTLGNKYLLVRDVNYLDDKVFALDLSNRNLKAIPPEVFKHPQLKFLNLSGNQISRIASVKTLDSLRNLKNSKNLKHLGNLKNLEHLDLSNNLLTNLPDDVYKLTSLKTLQIRGNRLGAIPTALGRLVQLELLDLSANEIEKFPDSTIVNLQKLTRLDLSENKIETIPSGIGQLKDLTRLYLQNNELKKPLPDEIGALSKLKDLNLSYNYLTELPTTLSKQLPPLDLLDVSFNALTQLPPDLNVRLFFNCSGNRLTERPSFSSKPEMLLDSGNHFNNK